MDVYMCVCIANIYLAFAKNMVSGFFMNGGIV